MYTETNRQQGTSVRESVFHQGTSVREPVSQHRPLTIALIRHEQPATPFSQSQQHHLPQPITQPSTPFSQSHEYYQLPVSSTVCKQNFELSRPSTCTAFTLLSQDNLPCSSSCSTNASQPSTCTALPSQITTSKSNSSCQSSTCTPLLTHRYSQPTPSSVTPPNCTHGLSPPVPASLIRRELVDIASKCHAMANQIDLFSSSSPPVSSSSSASPPAEALALIEKNVQLTSEIAELKTCKEEWKRRCSELDHKLASLQDSAHRPDDGQEAINAVIKESKRQIESIEAKLRQSKAENESLRRELNELHGTVLHMSAQLVTYKEDFENERKDRERAQGRIAELETQLVVTETRKPSSQPIGRGGANHHRHPRHSQGSSIGYDMCDDIQCDGTTVLPPTAASSSFASRNSSHVLKSSCAFESDNINCLRISDNENCRREDSESQSNFTNYKKPCRTLNGFDETDCKLSDGQKSGVVLGEKFGKIIGDLPDNARCNKGDAGRVSSKGGQLLDNRDTEEVQGNTTSPKSSPKDGNLTGADSASPLDKNCKFFLGTPVDDILQPPLRGRGWPEVNNSASQVNERGLPDINQNASNLSERGLPELSRSMSTVSERGFSYERSQTNGDHKRLRKNLSDISCLRAVEEDNSTCFSQSLRTSMYVPTFGVGSPSRSRLQGTSTTDALARTTSGAVEAMFGSKHTSGAVEAMFGSKHRVTEKSTRRSGAVQDEKDEEEPLQCPRCRKRFRVEDHYLLMEHIEEVCIK